MATVISDRELSEDVEHEQHELSAFVARVESVLSAVSVRHGHPLAHGTPGALRLIEMLDELREHLGMIFALKETDGYLEDAVSAAPRLVSQADALKAQHGELFLELCRLIDECDRSLQRRGHRRRRLFWRHVHRRFGIFCRQLADHHQCEARLLQQAFTEDVGVGD